MEQAKADAREQLDQNLLWYKDAVIYQLHVRAFCDSNGDGVGDFTGLTKKLDYIKDLGANTIWLLPFYPSPLKDDGYDIADYTNINSMYGSKSDFRRFMRAAHRLGLRVITELVLNHTSDQHAWFQRARLAVAGSTERDFYVWSDSTEKYKDARIIFKDFEGSNWTWDPVAKAYYWHRFYSSQPDLNFNNPAVQRAMFRIVDHWLEMGVDGLRLDAVPYLFESEHSNCENLPETHEFLKKLRAHIDRKFQNRMLLAEANQWPEDAMSYFGNGEECHMCFHFPLMPRMFMALEMEDRFPVVDILEQTPKIPDSSQWAIFLRNHDELTLEMVSDEERDYMYRVYAVDERARINVGIRRRLAPLLGNNRRKIELLNGLLFSLPGSPVIYYGDEIGMGDNIYLGDRNGVRTPLQWSSDRNAGFSKTNPQQLYLPVVVDHEFHYEAVNIETQQRNPNSLLWWMKRIVALRNDSMPLKRGDIKIFNARNRKVLSFIREYEGQAVMIVANMSRNVQSVELDLSQYKGCIPQELFGQSEFPIIGDQPYFLTLGGHQFYWFQLQKPKAEANRLQCGGAEEYREMTYNDDWEQLFAQAQKVGLEKILADYVSRAPWFPGQEKKVKSVTIHEVASLPIADDSVKWLVFDVTFHQGESESYSLPVLHRVDNCACGEGKQIPDSIIAVTREKETGQTGLLYDAFGDQRFRTELLKSFLKVRRTIGREPHSFTFNLDADFKKTVSEITEWRCTDSDHSSFTVDDKVFLKLVRRVETGEAPEAEVGKYLHKKQKGLPVPKLVGSIDLKDPKSDRTRLTLVLVQSFVSNNQSVWNYTLDVLGRYYEAALSKLHSVESVTSDEQSVRRKAAEELCAGFLPAWANFGQKTMDLHLAMSESEDLVFKPEPFTELYQRSLYQSVRVNVRSSLASLKESLDKLPEKTRSESNKLLLLEDQIFDYLKWIYRRKLSTSRIRYHGDYSLKNILFTGREFVVVNYEGCTSRTWSEHRIKRSPLFDIAVMFNSLDAASSVALAAENIRESDRTVLLPWKKAWQELIKSTFLDTYWRNPNCAKLFSGSELDRRFLVRFYTLNAAFIELEKQVKQNPSAAWIPIETILASFSEA